MMAVMAGLVVITTGGTIAAGAGADGVLRPARTGAELTAGLTATGPGIAGSGIEVIDLLAVDSSQLTPADWQRIGAAVDAAAAGGADGIVVTHGTDTLEETALWLELTYSGRSPVVVTGAARAADDPNADGPANLRDALTVAASPLARDTGVLVIFRGKVFAPLGTTKVGGAEVFGGTAPVGVVAAEFTMTAGKTRAHLGGVNDPPRVDIVAAYPGADGVAVDAFIAAGARGLVLEAVGSGNAGAELIEAARRAGIAGVAVAVTTRVPGGHTAATYGPAHELVHAGAVMVSGLRASQVRVLMMAALGRGLTVGDVLTRWR